MASMTGQTADKSGQKRTATHSLGHPDRTGQNPPSLEGDLSVRFVREGEACPVVVRGGVENE